MITQNKKAKGVIVKVLLTLPVFALLIFANCKSNENNAPKEEKIVAAETENVSSAVATTSQGEDEVYMSVEKNPEFPGGVNAMMDYLRGNLKYPESAKKNKQEGRVFIGFVVEKDGSVTNVKVLRGVCEELDNEAVRVVKSMPTWIAGRDKGEPVRVQYTLPIVFKLNDETTVTALSGTRWEGTGTGIDEVEGTKFVMSMTMDFYNDNDGLFVMKLTAQPKDTPVAQTVFENVALDFTYSFDGKSAGSIQPKNPDGSDLGEAQPPYGFVVKEKSIVVNFYDFKNDCGIEEITFVKK